MGVSMPRVLRFEGCASFRYRLVLATLSGRAVRIDNIRARSENPGLRDFEANLLRLLEKITDGCLVEINETGALFSTAMAINQKLVMGSCC